MRKRWLTGLSAVFFIFLLVTAAYAGEGIKPFTFKTIDGKVLDSRAMAGRPFVISVVASW